MKCKKCGGAHNESYHLRKSIPDDGYPISSKKYKSAHRKANAAEKSRYPEGFEKLKKLDRSLSQKGELAGKNSKAGQISVSKRVPKSNRDEVAMHERVESMELKKKKK